jgi:hypothetical protein
MDSSMRPIDDDDAIEFIVATFHEQLSAEDSSREPFNKADFATQLIMVLNTPSSILSDCSILSWLGINPITRHGSPLFGPIPPPDTSISDLTAQVSQLHQAVCHLQVETGDSLELVSDRLVSDADLWMQSFTAIKDHILAIPTPPEPLPPIPTPPPPLAPATPPPAPPHAHVNPNPLPRLPPHRSSPRGLLPPPLNPLRSRFLPIRLLLRHRPGLAWLSPTGPPLLMGVTRLWL